MASPVPPTPNGRSAGTGDDCASGAVVDAVAGKQAAGTAPTPDACSRPTADSFRQQGGGR